MIISRCSRSVTQRNRFTRSISHQADRLSQLAQLARKSSSQRSTAHSVSGAVRGWTSRIGNFRKEQNNAKEDSSDAWHRTRNQYGNRAICHSVRMYGSRTSDADKRGDGMVANEIYDRLGELMACCETVRDACKCDVCPIRETCLEESTFERVSYKVKVANIKKLIEMADEITEEEEERAKTEEQRRWEAEAEYWNLRRCDPDDYE